MKIRNGLISNSSSSSFIIKKENISLYQLEKLLDQCVYEKYGNIDDVWGIDLGEEDCKYIIGYTTINKFDMESFFFDNSILIKFFESEGDARFFVSEEARFDDY